MTATNGSKSGSNGQDPRRILIIGNSGSGKSTLAGKLASDQGLAHLDLDTLAWQPTEPPERTPLDTARQRILEFTGGASDGWVVEGCYADLVALLTDAATELVFLDRCVEDCQHNARQRPWEPHKYPTKAAQDENLEMLLEWIAQYPTRPSVLGRPAHEELFASFRGPKRRVTTR